MLQSLTLAFLYFIMVSLVASIGNPLKSAEFVIAFKEMVDDVCVLRKCATLESRFEACRDLEICGSSLFRMHSNSNKTSSTADSICSDVNRQEEARNRAEALVATFGNDEAVKRKHDKLLKTSLCVLASLQEPSPRQLLFAIQNVHVWKTGGSALSFHWSKLGAKYDQMVFVDSPWSGLFYEDFVALYTTASISNRARQWAVSYVGTPEERSEIAKKPSELSYFRRHATRPGDASLLKRLRESRRVPLLLSAHVQEHMARVQAMDIIRETRRILETRWGPARKVLTTTVLREPAARVISGWNWKVKLPGGNFSTPNEVPLTEWLQFVSRAGNGYLHFSDYKTDVHSLMAEYNGASKHPNAISAQNERAVESAISNLHKLDIIAHMSCIDEFAAIMQRLAGLVDQSASKSSNNIVIDRVERRNVHDHEFHLDADHALALKSPDQGGISLDPLVYSKFFPAKGGPLNCHPGGNGILIQNEKIRELLIQSDGSVSV